MDIKPIETVYNGYRFRSRLEARWAVFFDAAGIEYQYELQGYKLRNGQRYLPDFFLPGLDVFVEIKGIEEMDDGKADMFALDYCGFNQNFCNGIIKAFGDPMNDNMILYTECCVDCRSEHRGTLEADCYFADDGFHPYIVIKDSRELAFTIAQTPNGKYISPDYSFILFERYKEAEKTARQARFEHGETPIVRR